MTAVPLLSTHGPHGRSPDLHRLLSAGGSAQHRLCGSGARVLRCAVPGHGRAGLAAPMPGLKALTDRVAGPRQSHISFYTATFASARPSLLLAGWLGRMVSWDAAFGLLAAGPFLASWSFSSCTPWLRPPPAPPGRGCCAALPCCASVRCSAMFCAMRCTALNSSD
jgi:hypothetical protein